MAVVQQRSLTPSPKPGIGCGVRVWGLARGFRVNIGSDFLAIVPWALRELHDNRVSPT